MRLPRPTIRRLMLLILALALALGLGAPAVQVACNRNDHVHAWFAADRDIPTITWAILPPASSWSRLRWRLAGRPWDGTPSCGMGRGRTAEACYLEHPRARQDGLLAPESLDLTPALRAAWRSPPSP